MKVEDICKIGMMTYEEVRLLQSSARKLPDSPVVINIGAGVGTSSAAILEARPDAFVFSIDKRRKPDEQANLLRCGLDVSRCVRILGSSQVVGEHFPYNVDMVFVDGDHTVGGALADVKVWLPKITSGSGMIAFHDYDHPNLPDLKKVIDSRMHGYEEFGKHRYLIVYRV